MVRHASYSARSKPAELWSETIGALSDVLVQRPDWLERPSDLFAVLDTIDLNNARQRALERRPWPVRQTYERGCTRR